GGTGGTGGTGRTGGTGGSGESGGKVNDALADGRAKFAQAMQHDLNTSVALAAMFDLVRVLNAAMDAGEVAADEAQAIRETFDLFDRVLGVISLRRAEDATPPLPVEEIERLIAERTEAKKRRDFKAADAIRDDLAARGIILEDSAGTTRWKKK
ncbi:MAG TPA: DALR domain-containing protein, partial [Vicinamibacterales bacterium]|nr:DALR domain-containing protein [Vicinamibacterales bacterium]